MRIPLCAGVNKLARLAVLNAMPLHAGEATQRTTAAAIARSVGKGASTIHQMLYALKLDHLVECSNESGHIKWWRTAVPLPESFTSTANAKEASRHDDFALRQALGVPLTAPPVRGPVRVIKQR